MSNKKLTTFQLITLELFRESCDRLAYLVNEQLFDWLPPFFMGGGGFSGGGGGGFSGGSFGGGTFSGGGSGGSW